MKVEAVDLFCGAGGLTHGLIKSGIKVKVGVDIDSECRYPYEINNKAKFINLPIQELKATDVANFFSINSIKLLAGCAPCQTFSSYNQKANSDDEKWWLLRRFQFLVSKVKPDLVTMENVPGLKEFDVFEKFVKSLKQNGYFVSYRDVSCYEYGLPQTRVRLVLLASKFGPIELIEPNRKSAKTVKKAISKMPRIRAGQISKNDFMHQSCELSKLNYERIKASKPGGTWRDWPANLVADCHKKNSGKTYPGVYGRMEWDQPAPTITTQFYGYGNGRFGHPTQNRALSLREGALLQGFPKNYKFVKNSASVSKKVVGRLIGNAVPVPLGFVIGKTIIKHVAEYV